MYPHTLRKTLQTFSGFAGTSARQNLNIDFDMDTEMDSDIQLDANNDIQLDGNIGNEGNERPYTTLLSYNGT
jgi:hypothetical protein